MENYCTFLIKYAKSGESLSVLHKNFIKIAISKENVADFLICA